MKYVRSKVERQAAIDRLKQNKKKCKPCNFFGQDNHLCIDIMVDIIEKERSQEWIYQTYPGLNEQGQEDANEHRKRVSAINARDYLMGNGELEELLYPEL